MPVVWKKVFRKCDDRSQAYLWIGSGTYWCLLLHIRGRYVYVKDFPLLPSTGYLSHLLFCQSWRSVAVDLGGVMIVRDYAVKCLSCTRLLYTLVKACTNKF